MGSLNKDVDWLYISITAYPGCPRQYPENRTMVVVVVVVANVHDM